MNNSHRLDFDFPETNDGVLPFRLDQVVYQGQMVTVCFFILLLPDPSALTTMTVEWNEQFNAFRWRREIVPNNLVGEEGKRSFSLDMGEKIPKRCAQWDGITKHEGGDLASKLAFNFLVFANRMSSAEGPPPRRFKETLYSLPERWKARPNVFGYDGRKIHPILCSKPFTVGKGGTTKSYGAHAVFGMILENNQNDIVDPPAVHNAVDELEQELNG